MSNNVEIKIGVAVDHAQSTKKVKDGVKKIEQEMQKTPMQIKIDAATGVKEISKVKKEYKDMFKELIVANEKMQSAISKSEMNNMKRREQDAKNQGKAINKNAELQIQSNNKMAEAFAKAEQNKRKELEKTAQAQSKAINRNLESEHRNSIRQREQQTQQRFSVQNSLALQRQREMSRAHAEALQMNRQFDLRVATQERQANQDREQRFRVQNSLALQRQREMAAAQTEATRVNNARNRVVEQQEQQRIQQSEQRFRVQNSLALQRQREQSRDLQLSNYQTNFQNRVTGLQTGSAARFVNTGRNASDLASLQERVRALNTSMPNLRLHMQGIDGEFRRISTSAQNASRSSMNLGESLKQAAIKYPKIIWGLVA